MEFLGGLNTQELRINQEQLHPNCVASLSRPFPSAGVASRCVKDGELGKQISFHRVLMLQPKPSPSSLSVTISSGFLMNGFN